MNPMKWAGWFAAGVLTSGTAQPALYDRGAGLIYDDVLDITWLQDANYAKSSGYDNDGRMYWQDAAAWVSALSYYDTVRNVTWSDWRLPQARPLNGLEFNDEFDPSGATDFGYNLTGSPSELAHMFFQNLGLISDINAMGSWRQNKAGIAEVFGTSDWIATTAGIFRNIWDWGYWTETDYAGRDYESWYFNFSSGLQGAHNYYVPMAVWAVRDGDVAAIPEPTTLTLLLVGLIGLGARRLTA